nr:magnesium chelatase subunit D [Acidisphaera sp. L21]
MDWADARTAATLFAVDPAGTGGVSVRAPPGPVRDRWLAALRGDLPEGTTLRRLPPTIPDDRLLGGIDLALTLGAGRPVTSRGLLEETGQGVLLLAMAERMPVATIARLAAARDAGMPFGIAALDEGATRDERPSASLLDRLAFHVELEDVAHQGQDDDHRLAIAAARRRLPGVCADAGMIEALCATAAALGIDSLRAPLLALRAARAAAALAGRDNVTAEDAALAGRLVLAPRATALPAAEQEAGSDDTPEPGDSDSSDTEAADPAETAQPLADIVLEAAQAAIPPGLLQQLRSMEAVRKQARSMGLAGALHKSGKRGRPAGVCAGDPRQGLRLNLMETLRAAAPWQALRRRSAGPALIEVRRNDFRVNRVKQRSETTTIFIVDASGSAALNRLAEAKGAVELLLAECYVRRDRVAVFAFRGRGAQLLLPPTRSLVRAKRSLSGLPGGGGTPLAAGIDAGSALAEEVRRRGGTPTLVLLTDGRANVTRDGTGNRALAEQEAGVAARQLGQRGFSVLLVDTSPRPHPPTQRLAMEMRARYVALPYADAAALSRAIQAAR